MLVPSIESGLESFRGALLRASVDYGGRPMRELTTVREEGADTLHTRHPSRRPNELECCVSNPKGTRLPFLGPIRE